MNFPNEIEELLTNYCNMYYQLNSISEYKNDIRIKIYFNDPDGDAQYIEADLDRDFDHQIDQIFLVIEYNYKDNLMPIKHPLWVNTTGLTFSFNKGICPITQPAVNFNDLKFIKYIFDVASTHTITYEEHMLESFRGLIK